MTEDDDWFERALTEQENGDAGPDGTPDEDGEPTDGATATDEGAPDEGGGLAADDGEPADDDDPFEDDFAGAFGGADAPAPADGESADDGPFGGGDGPFDGDGGADSPFGGGDQGGGPFGGGDEFGMGDFGAPDGTETEFDAEPVDSDIDRIDLGIDGLDEMIRGGVPERSLMAIIGSAGTGKTTFGLQFLEEALSNGEKAIYITLEESSERVVRSAEEKGWPFREYVDEGRLAVVDLDPIEMANSLSSIRSELPRLVDRFGATRVVLDSVSLLEMMYEDRATRRNEIYTFARSLKEAGVTVLLTSEASVDDPYASRHGIVEYLTDAVYVLQYVRPSDFRETRLAVEIQKIRDAHHSREMKPYEITDSGISVYRQANIF